MLQEGAEDPEDVRRAAQREAATLQQLRHPHVVDYLGSFEAGTTPFLVMEYLPRSLSSLMHGQGLASSTIRSIMLQLCTAISFMHGKVRAMAVFPGTGALFHSDSPRSSIELTTSQVHQPCTCRTSANDRNFFFWNATVLCKS